MKRIFLFIPVLLISIAGFAQLKDSQSILDRLIWDDEMLNIMLDTRIDFNTTFNSKVRNMSFQGQTFKLWLVGEIVPGVRYRVRHRLNRPQNPLREGYSAATDQAFLAFDIKDKFTITAGKQSVQFGTFEYDYNPADIYLPTMCFDDLDAYKTGVNVAYKFLGQVINLQVVNSDAPQFARDDYKNKAIAPNLLWEGNFLQGAIRTRWAYGAFQHSKSKFYNWITCGTQLNMGMFTTEIDYYGGNRNMDYGSVVDLPELGTRYVEDQSLSLNFKMNSPHWRPFIKGTWNQRYDKDLKEKAYQNYGVQTVVEYYPFEGKLKDLRFHFAYQYSKTNFKESYSELSNKEAHTLLVGTRWLFKVK